MSDADDRAVGRGVGDVVRLGAERPAGELGDRRDAPRARADSRARAPGSPPLAEAGPAPPRGRRAGKAPGRCAPSALKPLSVSRHRPSLPPATTASTSPAQEPRRRDDERVGAARARAATACGRARTGPRRSSRRSPVAVSGCESISPSVLAAFGLGVQPREELLGLEHPAGRAADDEPHAPASHVEPRSAHRLLRRRRRHRARPRPAGAAGTSTPSHLAGDRRRAGRSRRSSVMARIARSPRTSRVQVASTPTPERRHEAEAGHPQPDPRAAALTRSAPSRRGRRASARSGRSPRLVALRDADAELLLDDHRELQGVERIEPEAVCRRAGRRPRWTRGRGP